MFRLIIVLLSVSTAHSASVDHSPIHARPLRTVTGFYVELFLSCKNGLPFEADLQLWESNTFVDEEISDKRYIFHYDPHSPKHVTLRGEMFTVDEPGQEFEPYVYITSKCLGGKRKTFSVPLGYCPKKKRHCIFHERIDLSFQS